jgi:signal transduction histidine kinase
MEIKRMNRLLIIDDELPILEMMDLSLSSEGYEILTAESGENGLEIFEREKPGLIITDIKMPGMDGLEVLRRIRGSQNEAEVIVITGHGDMDTAITALQHGASDFITKPVREDALLLALERAREKIAMARSLREHTLDLERAVEERTRELRLAQEGLLKKERLATVGETVTGLAHYIKNILNGLRGGMYKMNSAMTGDEPRLLKDGWEMTQRNVEKISELVLDLLSYSKEKEPQRKPCNPNEIVLEVVESLRHVADENDVSLIHSLDPSLHEAWLDPGLMHRALLNLVSNAIEACMYDPDQSKSFEVSVKTGLETDDRGRHIMFFEVTDNGCGMSQEVKEKLFTRAFSTKDEKGTGIGLLITQRTIHEHGGEIQVESEEGVGTAFRLRLERGVTQ